MRRIPWSFCCLCLLAVAVAFTASSALAQPATQKLRVAVMDLSGSALKMQTSQTGLGGGMSGMPGAPGGRSNGQRVGAPRVT